MHKPSGGRAVQERRAPAIVEADSAKQKRWRELDFFASPPWSTRAGAELLTGLAPAARLVWEPACGDGIMAQCLEEYFDVYASDIEPQGYGNKLDFLEMPATFIVRPDWVVTNPPFARAADFVRTGLQLATIGVAVLCRLSFLESAERAALHFGSTRLSVLAPFCERVPMQLGPWNPRASTATAYAWFVYMHKPRAAWPIIKPILPGTKLRLSMPEDVRRFLPASEGALV